MRILHVITSIDPATGGPAEGLKQYCRNYISQGAEVEVLTLDDPQKAAGWEFPARVHAVGPGRGVYRYTPGAVSWLEKNVGRFDLVVINGVWNYNTLAAYRVLRKQKVPYAVFTHGMMDPYFKRAFPAKHLKKLLYWHLFLKRILNHASAVLFTAEDEKILARQSFPGYKVREQVIPYGTYGPEFDRERAEAAFFDKYPELLGKRLALTLGRIDPKKGTDILIEAFAQSLAKDPAWQLVIAGPDRVGWRKELEAQAARLGIGERITWTGMLQGELKWGAFHGSECFVLPSHQENFGIVVAEALACNLPVLLSDKVNIWREVVNQWAGMVCDDSVVGTTQMLALWAELSPEERAAVRQRALRCFDRNFNYSRTASRIMEIYQGLVR